MLTSPFILVKDFMQSTCKKLLLKYVLVNIKQLV
jgi:hypothetical protein